MRAIILVIACAAMLAAADDALSAFHAAMSGSDASAKKAAIQALGSKSAGKDDEVLPLLIGAIGDRQARDAAVAALRARTGLAPSASRGVGGFPNYPTSDEPADWNAWLGARSKQVEQDKKIKDAEALAADAKKTADGKDGKDGKKPGDPTEPGTDAAPGDTPVEPGTDTAAAPAEPAEPTWEADPEWGKLDRVIFKSGSALLCYIISRQTDATGHVTSLRVVHPGGGGEEILDMSLIARVEDDIQ